MDLALFDRIALKVKTEGTVDPFKNNPAFDLCRDYDLAGIHLTERQDLWSVACIKALYLGETPVAIKRGYTLDILDFRAADEIERKVFNKKINQQTCDAVVVALQGIVDTLVSMNTILVNRRSVITVIEQKINEYRSL